MQPFVKRQPFARTNSPPCLLRVMAAAQAPIVFGDLAPEVEVAGAEEEPGAAASLSDTGSLRGAISHGWGCKTPIEGCKTPRGAYLNRRELS